jgi:hypothetical protein
VQQSAHSIPLMHMQILQFFRQSWQSVNPWPHLPYPVQWTQLPVDHSHPQVGFLHRDRPEGQPDVTGHPLEQRGLGPHLSGQVIVANAGRWPSAIAPAVAAPVRIAVRSVSLRVILRVICSVPRPTRASNLAPRCFQVMAV